MKLYTEEQLLEAYDAGWTDFKEGLIGRSYYVISQITPIELPSDEEIVKAANTQSHYEGAMWLKYKILGKEDKTFNKKSKWTEVDNMTRRLK